MSEELHYLTITELASRIASKAISPVEVTEALLRRIEAVDGRLKAYVTVMAEQAMEQARRAESDILAGTYRGPLHGVPVAVKDLCFTAAVRTMGGSAVYADHIPAFDATVVRRFNQAGAVMLGKLNLTEGAMGGYNPAFQVPENPWKAGHWPGASSSGSGAATAAGVAYATLGSDTGGSIRYPAAVCGTVGLKPTWGRVSRYGVLALAESLDHVGPLTRSSADAGIVLQTIAGLDPNDPTSLPNPVPDMLAGIGKGVSGLRIGWDEAYATEDIAPDFAQAVAAGVQVMARLGADIVPVKMPARLREYLVAWPVLCTSEALAAHREHFPTQADIYGPWFRGWLERGAAFSAADYAQANTLRAACVGELRLTMQDVDLLACPSTAQAAYPYSAEQAYGPIPPDRDPWQSRFTVPTDFAGLPTIALPCGLSPAGLPLSLQFVGHALSEPLLIQAGDAYEKATEWHKLHPPGW
ncbi:MAG: amidase [bacterium]|nr:amidase [bacterium]